MHLYLCDTPRRTLFLVTSSEEERRGCPRKALVFRAAEGRASSQAVVEFLPKDEIDLNGLVKLTNRPVIGCLGTIQSLCIGFVDLGRLN